jgi:tetratricopeptide (TPR) repeat protein
MKAQPQRIEEGVRAHERGDLDAAERIYRTILDAEPGHAQALGLLGAVAFARKRFDEAEQLLRTSLERDPRNLATRYNLGRLEERNEQFEEAAERYRGIIKDVPRYAPAHARLGIALYAMRDFEAARAALERALELRPDDAESTFNLGVVEDELGRARVETADFAEAERLFRSAAARIPHRADPLANLTFLYHVLGRVDEAIEQGSAAIAIEPEHAQSHVNLGQSYLVAGEYARGWEHSERRSPDERFARLRRWDGTSLGGRRLLISREQGLGDFILFSRFFPEVKSREVTLVVEAPPQALPLYERFPGIDELVSEGAIGDLSRYAAYLPIASIPYVLGVDARTIPGRVPYLFADARRTQAFVRRFAALGERRKVGIVWAGSPGHAMDPHRSCSLAEFGALAEVRGIAWISLQKGPGAEEAATAPDRLDLLSLEAELATFEDTAAAIAALDLVVCVDTSVAHLAGALGKPVWLLNGFGNYWLWGLRAPRTPWYPTMRQFHQTRPDDWKSLFADVRAALCAWQESP